MAYFTRTPTHLFIVVLPSSWPMSRGRPHGLCHEDAYSPIHSHIAVLVAYVTRTSSWPLHEDAYNRQTRPLDGARPPQGQQGAPQEPQQVPGV